MASNVRIEGGYHWKKKVSVDGKELPYVSALTMTMEPGMVTSFDIQLQGEPTIDVLGSVCLDFTPQTVSTAMMVIKEQIKTNGVFRDAFKASIESAIRDYGDYPVNGLAEKILERITGEESNSWWQ